MSGQRTYLYVGGPTRPTPYYPTNNAKGISTFSFDQATGAIAPVGLIEGIDNPTWIGVDAKRKVLHVNSEVFGWNEGTVSAYAVDPADGTLSYINKQPTLGSIAAFNSHDRNANFLLVANYSLTPEGELPNKAIAVLPIREDGGLKAAVSDATHAGTGPDPERQERPHPHCVRVTPDNRHIVVADLGLDLLVVYRFDAQTGAIARAGAASVPAGAGPRHFVFHPRGNLLYVANELDSTVTSFAFEADQAKLTSVSTISALPESAGSGSFCSEIAISADGAYLYVANRGHDSIGVIALDSEGGMVLEHSVPCGGQFPRHFAIDPSGNFLVAASQNSDKLAVFAINKESGELTPTGTEIPIGTPTCVAFLQIDEA
ncbi:lactonase family protein [Labrys sp. KB_33_2]|uniref:lactonase family protein n=1 Tax=Labrys sp. KB_33_2 TaxID=3237479 RepID=UPI003F8E0D7C